MRREELAKCSTLHLVKLIRTEGPAPTFLLERAKVAPVHPQDHMDDMADRLVLDVIDYALRNSSPRFVVIKSA